MKYNTRDLAMTQDYNEETQQWEPGDLMLSLPSIDHNGLPREGTVDLYTRSGYDNVRQMLAFRFLTRQGDYVPRPALGQNLERIMGRRMTPDLVEEGRRIIIRTITYDGWIDSADLEVTGIPFDRETIIYNIGIRLGGSAIYRFNLRYSTEQDSWRLE